MVLSRRRSGLLVGIGVIALLLPSAPAHSQGVTGTISGIVQDAQGGVLPGATVTITSESRGTASSPVVTNATGNFVIPNVAPDTYTIQVEMPQFSALQRRSVPVSPGDHVALGALVLQIGAASEVITVTGEAPLIQAASSERSFTIGTDSVRSLPLAQRGFEGLLALAPGVDFTNGNPPAERLGGGGGANFMVDGATAVDPALNRPAARVTVETVAEVRVVTSGYQAEYGRASGLQVNAVTKSGTNEFRGSLYDIERNSKWNAISRTAVLNGDPKSVVDERDWGFAIGGPVGKPGGANKLFFYFNAEFNPRTFGGGTFAWRVPTALERQGDFSQSTDNLGRPFTTIRDWQKGSAACTTTAQATCFADGGVLGRIPADRLYQPGLAVLRWWPLPNIANVPDGQAFNYQRTDPPIDLLGWQPTIRLDYQPISALRIGFKHLMYLQPNDVIPGTIPGWNDNGQHDYGIYLPSGSVNWTVSPTMFVEGTWGLNWHHQEGCTVVGGAPNFCRQGLAVNPIANRITAGFGAIPHIFPDANKVEEFTWSYKILSGFGGPVWDGSRIQAAPAFTWGNRIANPPPNNQGPFGNTLQNTEGRVFNASVTNLRGNHTFKAGYSYVWTIQARSIGAFLGAINFGNDNSGANTFDTGFGFANAATGNFTSYQQVSRLPEGGHIGINHEWFVQDTWKGRPNLTLDYGLRFVRQRAAYDSYFRSANFLPERWVRADAPALYVPGCFSGASTCTGDDRQARNPLTGAFLGPKSAAAIGTIVPGTGNPLNGLFTHEQILPDLYKFPALAVAPRFGAAWDLRGNQSVVLRGSFGLFYDREGVNLGRQMITNPPYTRNVTRQAGLFQDFDSGLATESAPALVAMPFETPIPSSLHWSTGVQMVGPFATVVDVAYRGTRGYNLMALNDHARHLNHFDFGAAFLPENEDPTRRGTSSVPGATSLVSLHPDLVRAYRGYGTIAQQAGFPGWRLYHGIEVGITRRLRNGWSFGLIDSISLYDREQSPFRVQHNADGSVTARADQAEADRLLGNLAPRPHIIRANFNWQLPGLPSNGPVTRGVSMALRGWSLSGIWRGESGTAYSANYSYQSNGANVNITGSPNYGGRVRISGDHGSGCSDDPLRQFETSVFQGPLVGSVGLESAANTLRGCFVSQFDMSLARTIRLGGGATVQLRADVFNLFNQAAITGRNASAQFASPSNPTTIQNLPFDANGDVIVARSRPRGAGFGVATAYQDPRTTQVGSPGTELEFAL